MAEDPDKRSQQRAGEPRQIRLPGFISDETIGLGDAIKRVSSVVGIRPCGPCAQRAQRLNNWLVFRGRGK